MIDIDTNLERVSSIASDVSVVSDGPFEFLDNRYAARDRIVVESVDFRRLLLTDADRERFQGWIELGFFGDDLPLDTRVAAIAFAFDVSEAIRLLEMRALCAPYNREDRLFTGAPCLWEKLRRTAEGRVDYELIDFSALRQECGSEVVTVPGGYGKIPADLSPHLVAWLFQEFARVPFFIRLLPDKFSDKRPPMLLTEAAAVPGRFDALMKFDMFRGQTEYGEYILDDQPLVHGEERRYLDYHVDRIRRLEIGAELKKENHLTMMIEELPAPDGAGGLMVGRCIHLDTDKPQNTPVQDVKLSHLDLALNVYEGTARADRYDRRLKDGKVTDASFRTHLMRIENIPLLTLLPICAGFLKSSTLLREWMQDLQVPAR